MELKKLKAELDTIVDYTDIEEEFKTSLIHARLKKLGIPHSLVLYAPNEKFKVKDLRTIDGQLFYRHTKSQMGGMYYLFLLFSNTLKM